MMMARSAGVRFVAEFLVPLVNGGTLHVGRPLGLRTVERMTRHLVEAGRGRAGAVDIVAVLAEGRRAAAAALAAEVGPPPLDETTLRLGAALHDLLALAHPALEGHTLESRQERIAAAALELASVGFPRSPLEALHRHSLLARLPEIGRSDRTVYFWLGHRAFVGRVPPRRITALPRLRNVRVEIVRRSWLREIGIPAAGRDAFVALSTASPLGEALDPFRLEPPLSWSRILPVLRFSPLCRLVASRIVDLGVDRAGDALSDALFRFASLQEPAGGMVASPEAIAFAIRFLAHTVWLDLMFSNGRQVGSSAVGGGLDLAAILVAARRAAPTLVWPRDVRVDSDLGRLFSARLDAMAAKIRARRSSRGQGALDLVAFASGASTGQPHVI
ncbi:MAG TPA: hypothetical protein VFH73_17975 [Polyangia bacterium]|jgi:hypothetical protein|nr:hypothetical protein [Polyangia bacterium]